MSINAIFGVFLCNNILTRTNRISVLLPFFFAVIVYTPRCAKKQLTEALFRGWREGWREGEKCTVVIVFEYYNSGNF